MSEDHERRTALLAAEARASELFDAIEATGVVAAGKTEREVEEGIRELAEQRFGVTQHWHRRIVRSGPHTLTTAFDHPDDRMIEPEDTVYVDLGPVFEPWEADLGRSYAMGAGEDRRQLVADLPRVFDRVQAHYHASPDITGAQLYAFAQSAAEAAGWAFGGRIAGHLVGEFPHYSWPAEFSRMVIAPTNETPMRGPDHLGRARHWILEIHLVDQARTFGGFYERLL
jgi:Xaa-Pro aminopeptidase